MPFAIGKAFSDELEARLQREREAEADQRAKAYSLQLQRAGMLIGAKQSQRELALKERAMAGDDADRQTRLEMARADRALQERKLDLDAGQFQQQFGQRGKEFEAEKALKERGLDLSGREQDWREFAGAADIENRGRQLDLGEAELGEKSAQNEWERNTKFPTEAGLKADEISRKSEADATRARLIDAQVQNLSAKTNLTEQTAQQIMANLQIKDAASAVAYGKMLIQQYDALANGMNGPGDPEAIKYAQEKMTSYLAALQKADPGAYGVTMRTIGVDAARASGSPFGQTGYGSAGSVMDEMLKRAKAAREGKPPPVPSAGK